MLGNQRFHGFITNHQPIYKKQKTEHSTKFITKNYAPLPQKITDMKHNDQKTTQITGNERLKLNTDNPIHLKIRE